MDPAARQRLLAIIEGKNTYGELVPADGGRPGGVTRAEQLTAANTLLQAETTFARIDTEARAKHAEMEMNERLRREELRLQEEQVARRAALDEAEARARIQIQQDTLQLEKARLLVEVLRLAEGGSKEARLLLGPLQTSILGLPAPVPASEEPSAGGSDGES